MKAKPLTDRQAQIVAAIRRYHQVHGYAPTFEELADHQGVDVSTLRGHLLALRHHGVLDWVAGQARTLHLRPHSQRPTK